VCSSDLLSDDMIVHFLTSLLPNDNVKRLLLPLPVHRPLALFD
jgi:hypothetical protein